VADIEALAETVKAPVTLGVAGFPGAKVTIPAGWVLVVGRDWSTTYMSPKRFREVYAGNPKVGSSGDSRE
jgi:hypothetical protein